MPMHNWTRVSAGTFHDFHNAWITHIKESLNAGLIPNSYCALGEKTVDEFGPHVLTRKAEEAKKPNRESSSATDSVGMIDVGMIDVGMSPPNVHEFQEANEEIAFSLQRQRAVVIRHASGDRVVAIIEIVSRANRHSMQTLSDFTDKVIASLQQGIHVVVIDSFSPGRNDPDGIHGLIWERMMAGEYHAVEGLPLTLVSYTANYPIKAWIEPYSVGATLTAMPLFLTNGHYIPLPLEETYCQSWAGVPERWKRVVLTDK